MTDPSVKAGEADRYLFYSAQRGLRDAVVQTSARYRATFGASAAPGISITGVWFTGSRYVESPDFNAYLRLADRRLTVGLSTDARRYAPGDKVTIAVDDPGPDGRSRRGHGHPASGGRKTVRSRGR